MRFQVSVVGVAAADTGHVDGQVRVFILLAEILRAAVQYDDQYDDRRQTEQDNQSIAKSFHTFAPFM